MAMIHNSLLSYYENIFALSHNHKWSISEIEDLLPWELDVMITLLNNYLEQQRLQREQDRLNAESMR